VNPLKTYKGSCHCGRVAFEVEGELEQVMACNCSICSRKGSLLWFVPRERLRLVSGKPMAAINVRCLEGVELASLPVKHFDGRSL
jgi:hypothetical protein